MKLLQQIYSETPVQKMVINHNNTGELCKPPKSTYQDLCPLFPRRRGRKPKEYY